MRLHCKHTCTHTHIGHKNKRVFDGVKRCSHSAVHGSHVRMGGFLSPCVYEKMRKKKHKNGGK